MLVERNEKISYDFAFKPFGQMTAEDYATVGYMAGLEVHQLLLTDKKLFCRCPAGRYTDAYHAEILRHMRPTLSELGEYDGTALMEFKTKKNIIYRINRESVCTYEMDDTPPFMINEQALDIAISIGLLFNASIVDELHIARKQYLDGSIPTGFQRTAIYCVDGRVPYGNRQIDILQMSIEEDSCREISDSGHERIYKTDRLGMPLIESVTAPQMKTPHETAEVCEILRRAVRATGLVRTGAGASREDVNVSVAGGTRVEIKGVPSIKAIPILTHHEAMRQWNLLRLRQELHGRGITEETFKADSAEVTEQLQNTNYEPIAKAVKKGCLVKAVTLRGFNGLLTWETQTNTDFAREISDRVRVIACLTELPNIAHSDAEDTLSDSEWKAVKKAVKVTDKDTVVLVWGGEEDSTTGVNEIIIRARESTTGIPSETRQALDDGTNGFERILPGADRMYPDTDLPPECIKEERLERIRKMIPQNYWEREPWYRELALPEDVIVPLTQSSFAGLFERLVKEQNVNPTLAAVALIQYPKRLRKLGLSTEEFTVEAMQQLFEQFTSAQLPGEAIYELMKAKVSGTEFNATLASEGEVGDAVKNAEKEIASQKLHDEKNRGALLLAQVMTKLRGRVSYEAAVAAFQTEKVTEDAG